MVIHTNENGLLDLNRRDTHIHNIEAKTCKVNDDSATYLWHCRLGHIGVKRMKKLHADGLFTNMTQTAVPQISCTIIINSASFGFNIMNMCITTIEIHKK